MKASGSTAQSKFYQEVGIRLAQEGFDTQVNEGSLLQVFFHGVPLCQVAENGGTRYRQEDVESEPASSALDKVNGLSSTVAEYMRLVDSAPPLKASSLDAPYKQILDFNGYVLGAMESKYGVQFTSWEWSYDKSGLSTGHYFGNDYAAAKKDFALRTGLIPEEKSFTPEQLIEIYRCCADTLSRDYELTYEQEQKLDAIQTQITEMVPDFAERMKVSLNQDASQQQVM